MQVEEEEEKGARDEEGNRGEGGVLESWGGRGGGWCSRWGSKWGNVAREAQKRGGRDTNVLGKKMRGGGRVEERD